MSYLNFVVSTGRCGSTLLTRLLKSNPGVLSVSELFGILPIESRLSGVVSGQDFWRQLSDAVPLMDVMVREGLAPSEFLYPYGAARFTPEAGVPFISHMTLPMLSDKPDELFDWLEAKILRWPERPVPEHYRQLFTVLCERFDRQVVVERSGGSIASVASLRHAFPEARFIYLSRDGLDCAMSMSKHACCRLPVLGRRIMATKRGGSGPVHSSPRRVGDWPADLDMRQLVRTPIPLNAFGNYWSDMTLAGATDLSVMSPDRWTSLRYEDLLSSPIPTLNRLARFLGTPAPQDWLTAAAGTVEPARAGSSALLSPEQAASLRAACAPGSAADDQLHALCSV